MNITSPITQKVVPPFILLFVFSFISLSIEITDVLYPVIQDGITVKRIFVLGIFENTSQLLLETKQQWTILTQFVVKRGGKLAIHTLSTTLVLTMSTVCFLLVYQLIKFLFSNRDSTIHLFLNEKM